MKPVSPAPWLPMFCCVACYFALVCFSIATMFGQVEMGVLAGILILCYVNTERIKR